MNEKERQRKAVCEMVKQRRIKLTHAAQQCALSYRQMLRIYADYLEKGDAGLIHQSRGQRSNRKHPHREEIIAIYEKKYDGFGPTLASEYLLEEERLFVNHETLRQWLLSEGLWKKQRKRSPYRQRREPKGQFGEMVQIDGSIHDWLETGEHKCLLNMVDDATSKTLSKLDEGETTRVVFECIWKWIERYGIPLSFYVDLKNVYVSPKLNGFSHLQIACEKLGLIKAYSPQAKGRVERHHGVYQDRFVKELRLRQIKTIEEANQILDSKFIDKLNNKFEKPARNPVSAHRPLGDIDLNQVLCWEYERQVQHDWTFSFSNTCYQIEKNYGSCVKPKSKITIRKHLDGSISVWFKEKRLGFKALNKRPVAQKVHCLKSRARVQHSPKTSWHQSNSFLFEETDTHHSNTLRKRHLH